MARKSWFNFISKAPDSATVMMYGEIGKNGVKAADFLQELDAIKASKLFIRMHSPGGDVFDGMLIYEGLKASKAEINIQVDGVAASIASTICMAGKVTMAKSAMMMMHRPYAMSGGNSEEMRSTCDALDQICANMVTAYSEKTKIPDAKIMEMLKAETWLNAEKCKALGFCDCIGTMGAINAAVNLSSFSNVPEEVKAFFIEVEKPANERDLETFLRDSGMSKQEALAAVSTLKTEARRDSEAADGEKFRAYMQAELIKTIMK